AFVLMPNEHSVTGLLWASLHGHLTFKEHKLFLYIVKKDMVMTPNISPSDTIKLREALRSIGSIRNFLPLLNKTPPPSASKFSTIMLTGLPEGNYKHEDVAKLVWRYFPKQNLQTLYYNILVLPLQRRVRGCFCAPIHALMLPNAPMSEPNGWCGLIALILLYLVFLFVKR
ncbi:hypothetical protein GOODEAATRI_002436, partial [Goodea atripinnis]